MNHDDNKPNLFIIGSMKSGTTSLHSYLDLHPDIFMSEEKEPGYFVPEINRARSEDSYLSLFAGGRGLRYRGESSTHYTKLPTYPGVPGRLYQFAPNARLIYIMRHPIERTISHYWHAVRDVHLSRENQPIVKALRANPVYTAYSDYAMQLRAFYSVFPRERIYFLTLEALRFNPINELGRVFMWLDLPTVEVPLLEPHNAAPKATSKVAGLGILNWIRYSPYWSPFSKLLPATIRKRATQIAYKPIEPRLSASEREDVEDILLKEFSYAEKIRELEELVEYKFTEWKI